MMKVIKLFKYLIILNIYPSHSQTEQARKYKTEMKISTSIANRENLTNSPVFIGKSEA